MAIALSGTIAVRGSTVAISSDDAWQSTIQMRRFEEQMAHASQIRRDYVTFRLSITISEERYLPKSHSLLEPSDLIESTWKEASLSRKVCAFLCSSIICLGGSAAIIWYNLRSTDF